MAYLARLGQRDPRLADVARSCGNHLGIDSFCRAHLVYRQERDEVLRTIPFMLDSLEQSGSAEGDCDDMATFAGALCLSQGILARYTAVCSASPLEYDHVFCEARIGTDWIPIDPTVEYGTTYRIFGMMNEVV
jgi:hypothetical protein